MPRRSMRTPRAGLHERAVAPLLGLGEQAADRHVERLGERVEGGERRRDARRSRSSTACRRRCRRRRRARRRSGRATCAGGAPRCRSRPPGVRGATAGARRAGAQVVVGVAAVGRRLARCRSWRLRAIGGLRLASVWPCGSSRAVAMFPLARNNSAYELTSAGTDATLRASVQLPAVDSRQFRFMCGIVGLFLKDKALEPRARRPAGRHAGHHVRPRAGLGRALPSTAPSKPGAVKLTLRGAARATTSSRWRSSWR